MRRREFITGCSVACAAIGVVEVPSLMAAGAGGDAGLSPVGRQAFEALVGSRFRAYRGTRFSDALTLARVVEGPQTGGDLEQFTLVFEGAYRPDLPQGAYSVVDTDGASREMHLEPTGERTYRATFCLLRTPQTT
jgi:hypothetical protein